MRADRLIALLLLLQQRGRITAAEAATELEVSPRTARRDLEALAMSGVPVYSTHGRGGGWQLIGDATTDLTGLSSDEATALFLAAGSGRLAGTHLEAALRSGLRKLTGALPEPFRDEATVAASAIKVDDAGWRDARRAPADSHADFLDQLTRAVINGRQVRIRYSGPRSNHRSGDGWRTIHPLGLVSKQGVWYLLSETDKGGRVFRLNRIQAAETLPEAAVRPPDFNLDEAWDAIVDAVSASDRRYKVTAVTDANQLGPLRWVFGGHLRTEQEQPDGTIHVTISDVSHEGLAAQLAGFGGRIQIIDAAPEVLAELTRIAHELHERFATDPHVSQC